MSEKYGHFKQISEMKLNHHKVGLVAVLVVSAMFLCYSLVSHELPSMDLHPADGVWRFWNTPQQHHSGTPNAITFGRRKIYHTPSPQPNTTAPQTVYHKYQVNRKNLRRLPTLCVGDASLQATLSTCRLLEQRARAVQEVCQHQHVQQAPLGTERSHDDNEPGNHLTLVQIQYYCICVLK